MDDLTTSLPIINNRYQISGTVAAGGMAVIYKAQDLMLERPVALKILKKNLSEDLTFQNRFRQEARASARLLHPNIVTTFDFGKDRDRLFIVMEFVEGKELRDLMVDGRIIKSDDALDYLIQACRGLEYAHQHGLVHCDIKPQNLLVTKDNVLKITDFGISRALDTVSREEQMDVVWGSPMYISPDQAAGKAPSPATDIYSLGVIAYQLFAGCLPFTADDATELARMHRMDVPPSIKEKNPGIPDELASIIMRCLEKDPAARYSSAAALEKALSSVKLSENGYRDLKPENSSLHEEGIKPFNTEKDLSASAKPDMASILLGLLALILAGGLIPFWLYVFLSITSINR